MCVRACVSVCMRARVRAGFFLCKSPVTFTLRGTTDMKFCLNVDMDACVIQNAFSTDYAHWISFMNKRMIVSDTEGEARRTRDGGGERELENYFTGIGDRGNFSLRR